MATINVLIDRQFIQKLEGLLPLVAGKWSRVAALVGVNKKSLHRWKKEVLNTGGAYVSLDAICTVCKTSNCLPTLLKLPHETALRVKLRLEEEGWAPVLFKNCLFENETSVDTSTVLLTTPSIMVSSISYRFVEMGSVAPAWNGPTDELWLDVGNRLGPGVIDHHQLSGRAVSASRLVIDCPNLVAAAVRTNRRSTDQFTIVVQENTDLDCMAAAYLATKLLVEGEFPLTRQIRERFVSYVDRIDQGFLSMTQTSPFSLYSAFRILTRKIRAEQGAAAHESRMKCVRQSFRLFDYVFDELQHDQRSLLEIDAFSAPNLFLASDREFVIQDIWRYEARVADPRCNARQGKLSLPAEFGGSREVDALLVRDVANLNDIEDCLFFKNWARTDSRRARDDQGFALLCQFSSGCGHGGRQSAIISIKPEVAFDAKKGIVLLGLGEILELAEGEARMRKFGSDTRLCDELGRKKEPRPGYNHPDPWYDGRGHGYTIVDSPRVGTILSPDEIESILLKFGNSSSSSFCRLFQSD